MERWSQSRGILSLIWWPELGGDFEPLYIQVGGLEPVLWIKLTSDTKFLMHSLSLLISFFVQNGNTLFGLPYVNCYILQARIPHQQQLLVQPAYPPAKINPSKHQLRLITALTTTTTLRKGQSFPNIWLSHNVLSITGNHRQWIINIRSHLPLSHLEVISLTIRDYCTHHHQVNFLNKPPQFHNRPWKLILTR